MFPSAAIHTQQWGRWALDVRLSPFSNSCCRSLGQSWWGGCRQRRSSAVLQQQGLLLYFQQSWSGFSFLLAIMGLAYGLLFDLAVAGGIILKAGEVPWRSWAFHTQWKRQTGNNIARMWSACDCVEEHTNGLQQVHVSLHTVIVPSVSYQTVLHTSLYLLLYVCSDEAPQSASFLIKQKTGWHGKELHSRWIIKHWTFLNSLKLLSTDLQPVNQV